MNKNGPIVIIEDDADDRDLLAQAFGDLNYPNQIVFFQEGRSAIDFLKQKGVNPFLVISDLNMPLLNGFELRNIVLTDPELRPKCIPYLFFSTAVNQQSVTEAYSMSVQGVFLKPTSYSELVSTLASILGYWKVCYCPSHYSV